MALVLVLAALPAHAGEVGRSKTAARRDSSASSGSSPGIVASASDSSRIAVSGTMNAHNTGLDSIFVVADVAHRAANQQQRQDAIRNTRQTNAHRDMNITNLSGCRIIMKGASSCYGAGDGFANRKTFVGTTYNPHDMTAAFNSYNHLGKIIVVRNPKTNVARAVTVTDTGSFGRKYGRVIDLSAGAVEEFGLRCSPVSGSMKVVEVYACPGS
jgi:rare lipoprotein A (peptidoglycan hydrolase)